MSTDLPQFCTADGDTEKITTVDVWVVPVALNRPHVMSFGAIHHATQVLIRLRSSSGASGWGETTILGGPYWNEESAESAFAVLTRHLGPQLIGANLDESRFFDGLMNSIRRNHFALSALDIALHDLRARVAGVSVSELLGGPRDLRLPVSWSLANGDLARDLDELELRLEHGHHIFKIKTGSLPVDEDIRRVHEICGRVGDEVSVRIDANQGWSRAEAGRAIHALDDSGLAFIEQPLIRSDIEGSARLQASAATPLAADESLETLNEAAQIITSDAARVLVLKLAKHAGYRNGLAIADTAQANGLDTYLGCMIESSLGTAASLAFAAAAPPMTLGCELFGPSLIAEDLVTEPIRIGAGEISLPSGPGLGVDIDIAKVDRLATAHSALR